MSRLVTTLLLLLMALGCAPARQSQGKEPPVRLLPQTDLVSARDLAAPRPARKEYQEGLRYLELREWNRAREHFRNALALYGDYPSAWNNLGVALLSMHRAEEARDAFEKAIHVEPSYPNPYINLGQVLLRQEAMEEAEAVLRQAIQVGPKRAEAFTLLADAQLRQGKLEEAVASARRVHELDHSRTAYAHMIAAQALIRLERHQEAARECELYLEESPKGPNAGVARHIIRAARKKQP